MTRYTATCETCGYIAGPADTAKRADFGLRRHSCARQLARQASRARRLVREAAVDKAPKACTHKRARHVHGTHACYVLDRCRCPDCTAANTAYERNRARQHAYGRFTHMVDAQPVRDHIEHLKANGLGLRTIAARAGLSESTLGKLVYGSPRDGHKKSHRVKRVTAEKVLAVQATIDTLAGGALVPGVGTRRRLQALIAVGWSQAKLAREIGYTVRNFCALLHSDRDVVAATHRKVAALYDRLWDKQPPHETRGDKGARTRSLRYAQAHGWVPPLAWDDDAIDDPETTPDTEQQKRLGGKQIHVDDIEWVLEAEPLATAQRVGDRLGVGRDSIQQACRRAGRKDLLDLLSRNARLAIEGTAA